LLDTTIEPQHTEITQLFFGQTLINGMLWRLYQLENPRYPLLTSDRPVVMSNGFGYPESFILLPVTPLHVFLAANTEETCQRIEGFSMSGYFGIHEQRSYPASI
jgi:hypothetical protein